MLRRKVYHVQVGKESQTTDYNASLWKMYSGKQKCLIYVTIYVKKTVFMSVIKFLHSEIVVCVCVLFWAPFFFNANLSQTGHK